MAPLNLGPTDFQQALQMYQTARVDVNRHARNVGNGAYDDFIQEVCERNGISLRVAGTMAARALVAKCFAIEDAEPTLSAADVARKALSDVLVDLRCQTGTKPNHAQTSWMIFYSLSHPWGPLAGASECANEAFEWKPFRTRVSIGLLRPAEIQLVDAVETVASGEAFPRPVEGKPYLRFEWNGEDPSKDQSLDDLRSRIGGLAFLWSGLIFQYSGYFYYPLNWSGRAMSMPEARDSMPGDLPPHPDESLQGLCPNLFHDFLKQTTGRLALLRPEDSESISRALLFGQRTRNSRDRIRSIIDLCTAFEALFGGKDITRSVGQRLAFVVAASEAQREELYNAWEALYQLRGDIVHGHIGANRPDVRIPRVLTDQESDPIDAWLRCLRIAVLRSLALDPDEFGELPLRAFLDRLLLRSDRRLLTDC